MHLLGLTGGIGMGKSTCANLIAAAGFPVVDTDKLAHDLTQPGMPALEEIAGSFGAAMLDQMGRLDRRALALRVFADTSARRQLEDILHPRITASWTLEVEAWRASKVSLGVVVIPLLFETQAESRFDLTVCVACTRQTQSERLKARGWTSEEAAQRVAAQMPVDQKMERSDYVIWSEGELDVLDGQLQRVLRRIK